jgi:hypothetical protein
MKYDKNQESEMKAIITFYLSVADLADRSVSHLFPHWHR